MKIKAKELSRDLAVGFLVKNSSGEGVIGTNTAIEGRKIPKLGKNEEALITWKLPNIFGAGDYKVDIAVTSTDGTINHDWWEECLSFRVHKERSSPYIVSPKIPTNVTYKQ